jgi:hypothetical protein
MADDVSRERVERLLRRAGEAINANAGRCGLVEAVLCEVTALCCDLLELMGDDDDE